MSEQIITDDQEGKPTQLNILDGATSSVFDNSLFEFDQKKIVVDKCRSLEERLETYEDKMDLEILI